jgi:hypothetical protein
MWLYNDNFYQGEKALWWANTFTFKAPYCIRLLNYIHISYYLEFFNALSWFSYGHLCFQIEDINMMLENFWEVTR